MEGLIPRKLFPKIFFFFAGGELLFVDNFIFYFFDELINVHDIKFKRISEASLSGYFLF